MYRYIHFRIGIFYSVDNCESFFILRNHDRIMVVGRQSFDDEFNISGSLKAKF